jgi:signal transduction histidine kinase
MKCVEALEKLIENAIKFNDKEKRQVRIAGRSDGETIMLEIIDNGKGIPSEEYGRIFQKFYQVEEYFTGQIEGVGLGLALVKHIVELHGGAIAVESVLGKGSTFRLTLPILPRK